MRSIRTLNVLLPGPRQNGRLPCKSSRVVADARPPQLGVLVFPSVLQIVQSSLLPLATCPWVQVLLGFACPARIFMSAQETCKHFAKNEMESATR